MGVALTMVWCRAGEQVKNYFLRTLSNNIYQDEYTMPWLNLLFKDSTGRPLKQRPYELVFDNNDVIQDQTDDEGRLLKVVPNGVTTASLSILHRRFSLELDALPDVTEVAGVQERLNLLNFFSGRVDGDLGPRTRNALQSFQRSQGLPETGECDETTLKSLKDANGT